MSEKIFLLSERELHELFMKQQQLLEKVESNEKELQDARALAISQPGSISGMYLGFCIM